MPVDPPALLPQAQPLLLAGVLWRETRKLPLPLPLPHLQLLDAPKSKATHLPVPALSMAAVQLLPAALKGGRSELRPPPLSQLPQNRWERHPVPAEPVPPARLPGRGGSASGQAEGRGRIVACGVARAANPRRVPSKQLI